MSRIFNNFNDVYFDSLGALKKRGKFVESVKDGNSIGSHFGKKNRDFIEIQGYSWKLLHPRNRLISSEHRRASMGFNIANFLWFISGNSEVEAISFYNRKGQAFSTYEKHYEAAFGDRIFGKHNLVKNVIELLKDDTKSRRALIPLFFPEDLIKLPKDTPCASSIQLMIRNGKVDFFLHMRSQSAVMVFPYDIFLFTMLHEYLSILLNTELGIFNYYANSFHYYLDEQSLFDRILDEEINSSLPMDEMPRTTTTEIESIIKFETYLRNSIQNKQEIDLTILNALSEYWKELLGLLCIKAGNENDFPVFHSNNKYLSTLKLFI